MNYYEEFESQSAAELHYVITKNARNFEMGSFREMSIYLMATRFTREQILALREENFHRRKVHTRHSENAAETLLDWFEDHLDHPYPTNAEKDGLQLETGLTRRQIVDWFVNQRKRHWPLRGQHDIAPPQPRNPEDKSFKMKSKQVNRPLNPTDPDLEQKKKKKMKLEKVNCPPNPTSHPEKKVEKVNCPPNPTSHPEKKIEISVQVDHPKSAEGHVMHSADAKDVGLDIVPQFVATQAIAPVRDAFLSQAIAPESDVFFHHLQDQNSAGFAESIGCALDDVTHGAFMIDSLEEIADDETMPELDHDELTWPNFLFPKNV